MYIFNYDTFYKYYTNHQNSTTDKECLSLYMFPDVKASKTGKKSEPMCQYITVQGVKIYISVFDKYSVFVESNGNTPLHILNADPKGRSSLNVLWQRLLCNR